MSITRRQLMQLGALAALAEGGCCAKPMLSIVSTPPPPPTPPSPTANAIVIDFQGSYLLERKKDAMMVRLVDAPSIGLPKHLLQLIALESTIDPSTTAVPNQKNPAGGDTEWIFDLTGRRVTTPEPLGPNDLALPGPASDPSEDTKEIPGSDAGWNSNVRIADLRELCKATKITNLKAIAASVELTHGRVDVLPPGGIGPRAVWRATGPDDKVIMQRALSDKVRYTCPTGGQKLSIRIDADALVFKTTGGAVRILNVPADNPHYGSGHTPSMDHFAGFFKLVDKQISPKICLAKYVTTSAEEAGADYCPGGSI